MTIEEAHVRPYDMLEMHDLYDTGGDLNAANAYAAVNLTSAKAGLINDLEDLVQSENGVLGGLRTTAINDSTNDISAENVAVATLRSTAITDMTNAVNATGLSAPDKTALIAAITGYIDTIDIDDVGLTALITGNINTVVFDAAGLNTDQAAAVNAGISSTYNVNKSDVALAMKTDYEAAVTASGRDKICPECGGEGRYATFNPDGSPTGETNGSTVCDEFGYTTVQYIRQAADVTYIPAP